MGLLYFILHSFASFLIGQHRESVIKAEKYVDTTAKKKIYKLLFMPKYLSNEICYVNLAYFLAS